MILYKHPTNDICLQSFRVARFNFFDTNVLKDALNPIKSDLWKVFTALTTSVPIMSQLFLIKWKLNPSGPGLFKLPH